MSRAGEVDPDSKLVDERSLPSAEDIARSQQVTQPLAGGSGVGSAAASALGAAMLGLDQAIRREPPAQVVAADHQPERSLAGDDTVIIEIPEATESPRGSATGRPRTDRDG